MMRAEREELLRRYLEGGMSLEQEHEFFIQVAVDKELRHELKAHQTIDRAFQKDRVVDPSRYAALQGNVASMVAATSKKMEPVAESPSPLALRSTGSRFQKWMLGGLGGIALLLVIAAYVLIGPDNTSGSLPSQQTTSSPSVPTLLGPESRPDRNSAEADAMMAREADGGGEVMTTIPEPGDKPGVKELSASENSLSARQNVNASHRELGASASRSLGLSVPSVDTMASLKSGRGVGPVSNRQTSDSLDVSVKLNWKKK